MRNGDLALSVRSGQNLIVPALVSDHEEADTRLLLHAKHACEDGHRIVIQSPDTDVLLLCVSHYREIGCQELWFRTGVKDRLRYIPAHDVSTNLDPEICSALPAFHALTGCDSTSAFLCIGKKKAWKVLTKSTLRRLLDAWDNRWISMQLQCKISKPLSVVCMQYRRKAQQQLTKPIM